MALVAAGSSAAVSVLPSTNSCLLPERSASRSSSSGAGVESGGGRRRRIGAPLTVQRKSSFLGNYSFGESSVSELRLDDCLFPAEGQKGIRARCFAGVQGRRGRGGKAFFIPFGPGAAAGGGGGRGTFARTEWERRQSARQERLRELIEREMRARSDVEKKSRSNSVKGSYELLRELEKRLRAEEEADRKDSGGDDKVDKQSVRGEEETTGSSGASTYELMKELEKRLRAERDGQRGARESPRNRERSERDGRYFKDRNYTSLYEYMKEWNQEMRERRARLEEQWRQRYEDRVTEKTEKGEGEKFKDQKSWREESERGEFVRDGERKQVVDEDSNAAAGPKYPQSNGTVIYLKNEANGAEIYLVGTSHVSQKSVDEVKGVIERVKPDFVMLELCRKRYESMNVDTGRDRRQRNSPMAFVENVVQMLTNGNVGGVGKLVGVALASFYRLLSYRGFHPGKEFQVAIEEAKKVGAKVVLGDQDVETTLNHLGKFNLNMSMQDAFRFFGKRMPDDIAQAVGGTDASTEDMFERVRDRKVVRRFNEEMEKGAPSIYKALLADRNEVMVKALRNLKGKVVAVVGLAHLDGMEQLWHQANEKYLSDLGQSNATEG